MRTAGLVIDFYDDVNGSFLKQAFPTASELPEVVKEAHILSPEERDVLRDEAYALVMHNNGKTLRKFACVDEGNTLLSVLYFLENFDRLPEPAIKTAAQNLEVFCEEFGLEAPMTVKIAAKNGLSRKRDSMKQPNVSSDSDWAQRTNLQSIQGSGTDSGRVIPTANQMKTANADCYDMPPKKKTKKRGEKVDFLEGFHKLNPEAKPKDKKAGVPKGLRELADKARAGGIPTNAQVFAVAREGANKIGKLPNRSGFRSNYGKEIRNEARKELKLVKKSSIDVSGLEPIVTIQKTASTRTALNGKYALDSMADVQKAIGFFEENYKSMAPSDAHEFAVKTASRAEEIGLMIPQTLERYGATTYAGDIDAQMSARVALASPEFKSIYAELREKVAQIEPEDFANLLSEADEVSGLKYHWHGAVVDPYKATFGKVASVWSWTSRTGDFVSEEELRNLAKNGRPLVHKHFSSEMTNEFIKDPIAIFESMPDDSKCILARLAADRFDGLSTN